MKTTYSLLRKIPFVLLILSFFGSCYKDKGNYEYTDLPEGIQVDNESYASSYKGTLNEDYLVITPKVTYPGNESDLRFEWQIFKDQQYKTVSVGKDLNYKMGRDEFIDAVGSYTMRFAIYNNLLATDTVNARANMIFSDLVSLDVTAMENHVGLMVLHGDGQRCDVGLIQDNLFLTNATPGPLPALIFPNYYSSINLGEKIAGEGKQIKRMYMNAQQQTAEILTTSGSTTLALSTMIKGGHYSDMFLEASDALGKPEKIDLLALSSGRAVIDRGQIFYGALSGALVSTDFSYYAAPHVAFLSVSMGKGAVFFDTLTKSFLYCLNNTNTASINKYPKSTVTGVNLDPSDTKADLLYFTARNERNASHEQVAIMEDATTKNKFLATFQFAAPSSSAVVKQRYEMSGVPDYQDIKFYAVGRQTVMTYYGTSNSVYQYRYLESANSALKVWQPANPSAEKITMMKITKYDFGGIDFSAFANKQMMVATVDSQNRGKLYVLTVNTLTGALVQDTVFEGFEHIYDVDFKTL